MINISLPQNTDNLSDTIENEQITSFREFLTPKTNTVAPRGMSDSSSLGLENITSENDSPLKDSSFNIGDLDDDDT